MKPIHETYSLPIRCPSCVGDLTAEVIPAQTSVGPFRWVCPYCQAPHLTDFGGWLHWIAPRPAEGQEQQ